jgi:enoyl-CoA hydratase/carnithine racemase
MAALDDLALTTLTLELDDGVATVTLNRPEVYNSFDPTMVEEVSALWQAFKEADEVRAIVLTGAGEKAFCTGLDRGSVEEFGMDPLTYEDPGKFLGPKSQGLWKPVVAAVNGMACGGAFYFLGEADVLLAAEHATFFDPHVTFGMAAIFEPILLLRRMPFSEVLRMSLAGSHERISAPTAQQLGLVSEVTTAEDLLPAAQRLAAIFAASPAHAVQATLRSLWAAKDLSVAEATELGNVFLNLGTSVDALNEGQAAFESGQRIEPRIR